MGRQTGFIPPSGFITILEVKYRSDLGRPVSFGDVRGFVGTFIELIEQPPCFCGSAKWYERWHHSGPLCPCTGPNRVLVSNGRIINDDFRRRHGIAAVDLLAMMYRTGDVTGMIRSISSQLLP